MKKPDEKTGTDICFFLMSGAGLIDFFIQKRMVDVRQRLNPGYTFCGFDAK